MTVKEIRLSSLSPGELANLAYIEPLDVEIRRELVRRASGSVSIIPEPPESETYQRGYEAGYARGFNEGRNKGYDEGYDDGLSSLD